MKDFKTTLDEVCKTWMEENPCEDGHDHVTPFDKFYYGNYTLIEPAGVEESHIAVLRKLRDDSAGLVEDYPAPCVSRDEEIANVAALDAVLRAIAPQPPAEAQPVAEIGMSDDGYKIGYLIPLRAHRLPIGTKLYLAAPPSAPVGVEGLDTAVWNEVLELPEGFRVAEHLPGIWEYQFDIEDEADEDSDRKVSGTSWNHPALAAIAAWRHAYDALAQQPAAVDGARFRKAPCYLCGYNGAGYFQPETHPCAALYHAVQPGGSDNDR